MAGQQSFSAAVDAWTRETRERMEAVFKTAAQLVIEDCLDRVPVDTGFLKSSLTVTTDTPTPMRDDARPIEGQTYQPQAFSLTIATASLSTKIYATFVASYTAAVEYGARGRPGRAMVRSAAQNWPMHVATAVQMAKDRVSSNHE